jgi:hypothetical protein
MGTEYALDVEIEAILRSMYGKGPLADQQIEIDKAQATLPVSYQQRMEQWPELHSLQNLSLAARTAFVRAVRYMQPTGLVAYQQIGPARSLELAEGLDELAGIRLADSNPGLPDLLMGLTLKRLKQFAFDHGLKSHGFKHRLIEAIVSQVREQEVMELLDSLGDHRYIRILMTNSPLLKKQIHTEIHRLDCYLKWVNHIHGLGNPPLDSLNYSQLSDMELWYQAPHDPQSYLRESWNQTEIKSVREIWDAKCDEIIQDLVNKYAWDAPFHIGDAIAAYLPSDRLAAFKQACEANNTHAWYSVLMYYGEARMAEMGIKVQKPRAIQCAGCGKSFRAWSIPASMAERVNYRIYFCNDCYKVLYTGPNADPTNMSLEDMLNLLAQLARVLETVPSRDLMIQPRLGSLSKKNQIAAVKILTAMPSHKAYASAFGSWFKALVRSRVLDSGAQALSRGTRCLASDGHEWPKRALMIG